MDKSYNYILLSSNEPVYNYHFHPNNPLILGKNPEIGVKSFLLWYTYPNISDKYNNSKVRIFHDNSWTDINIPKGLYEVENLGEYLNNVVTNTIPGDEPNNTHVELLVDKSTFHCIVKLGSGIKIDFTDGDLYELLGLENKIYDQPFEKGKELINITRGVDKVIVRCDMAVRNEQKELRDAVYDLLPVAKPGEAILHEMENIEFYPCKNNVIRELQIKITDLDGNLLEMTEPYSLKLAFKSDKQS